MSRAAHRLLSSSLRSSARANFNAAARSPRAALTRRMMSSESHASHGSASSDTPWMIGSALVFGPLFLYLVSPTARKGSHGHADHGHQSHTNKNEEHAQQVESLPEGAAVPATDDEGTEVPAQEVKESMEKAFNIDSPKDAQEQEEVLATVDTTPENSAIEQQSQEEVPRDAAPSEPEPNPTSAVPAAIEGAPATSDEKTQGTDLEA